MRVARAGAAAFLLAVLVAPCLAGNHLPTPAAGDFVIKDFRFASGESLPELRIHYRALNRMAQRRCGPARRIRAETPRAEWTAWPARAGDAL